MVNPSHVMTLYRNETRMALRERTIVVNSILIPILLYPVILWLMFTGMMFVQGQTENLSSRVAIVGVPADDPLVRDLAKAEKIEVAKGATDLTTAPGRIRSGDLDALMEISPATGGAAALPGNVFIRLTFDAARERSAAAKERISRALETYRAAWLKREALARSVTAKDWAAFSVDFTNVASKKQMGGFILSLILPLFFVIMVAIGCFYPAVDSTAGERERNTWETLISSAPSTDSVVLAKYLYVATFGCVAGLLNMTAMVATMKPVMAPLLARAGEKIEFTVPLVALPVLLAGAVLLAAFVAAGMMIFASFARTFKEGQAMITPFYLVIIMPAVMLNVPGMTFSTVLAVIPVVNLVMMIREAISGVFHWPQIGITVAVSAALIVASLRLASFILRFEDVMIGSFGGSFAKFFSTRVLGRGAVKAPAEGVR
jgi:sodium transport system permease protein